MYVSEKPEIKYEFGLSEFQKKSLFARHKKWFDENNFVVDEASIKFIKYHWRVYATLEKDNKKKTYTFFMTPSELKLWNGFKRPFKVVHVLGTKVEEKIKELKKAIDKK